MWRERDRERESEERLSFRNDPSVRSQKIISLGLEAKHRCQDMLRASGSQDLVANIWPPGSGSEDLAARIC